MGLSADLTTAVAELLAANKVGQWQPSGAYPTTSLPAIFISVMPPSPDRAIVLTAYPVTAGAQGEDSTVGLQVRTRWSGAHPDPVNNLDEQVYQLLHNLTGHIGPVPVTHCLLQSGASLGQDEAKRWSRSANYYLSIPRPTPHHS